MHATHLWQRAICTSMRMLVQLVYKTLASANALVVARRVSRQCVNMCQQRCICWCVGTGCWRLLREHAICMLRARLLACFSLPLSYALDFLIARHLSIRCREASTRDSTRLLVAAGSVVNCH